MTEENLEAIRRIALVTSSGPLAAMVEELDATRAKLAAAEAEAENARLRNEVTTDDDRERMDWLARHITHIDWLALQNDDNIRAVIDAARAADRSE